MSVRANAKIQMNGAPLVNLSVSIPEGTTYDVPGPVQILCYDGWQIRGQTNSDYIVQMRRTGSANAFVDVATTPIDLSLPEYANQKIDFDIRIIVVSIAGAFEELRDYIQVEPIP